MHQNNTLKCLIARGVGIRVGLETSVEFNKREVEEMF